MVSEPAAARGAAPSRRSSRRQRPARRSPRWRVRAPPPGSRVPRPARAPRFRRGSLAASRPVSSYSCASSGRSSSSPPRRCASHRSSHAAMWPRSHTSGLMIGECTGVEVGVARGAPPAPARRPRADSMARSICSASEERLLILTARAAMDGCAASDLRRFHADRMAVGPRVPVHRLRPSTSQGAIPAPRRSRSERAPSTRSR